MKKESRDVLEYLYKHKVENGIERVGSLIQLPNIDGVNDLYHEGYVDITRDSKQAIKSIFITGKGMDWVKANNLSDREKILQYCYDHRFEIGVATHGLDGEVGIGDHNVLLAEAEYCRYAYP